MIRRNVAPVPEVRSVSTCRVRSSGTHLLRQMTSVGCATESAAGAAPLEDLMAAPGLSLAALSTPFVTSVTVDPGDGLTFFLVMAPRGGLGHAVVILAEK